MTNLNEKIESNSPELQKAYELVLQDIVYRKDPCGLFIGKYDAKNGNEHYMYGILTILEYISYRVSEEEYDKFSSLFIDNMIDSQNKAYMEGVHKNYECKASSKIL